MLGAIIGDIVGSIYEFNNIKTKEFEFFDKECFYTDDSVMSIAVGEALLNITLDSYEDEIRESLITSMKKWGRRYPYAGYGSKFSGWLTFNDTMPYNSYGNGSAMRVSAAGWLYDDIFTTRYMARLTAAVTHNHVEGIRGAEATAAAIFMARTGSSKDEIKAYIEKEFSYNLNFTCDEIRPTYCFNETCQNTVPQAIVSFLDGEDFEDVIRKPVSASEEIPIHFAQLPAPLQRPFMVFLKIWPKQQSHTWKKICLMQWKHFITTCSRRRR